MQVASIRIAIRTAVLTGLIAAAAVGVLGSSDDGAGVKQMVVNACGGDKALRAHSPAFSRCMRALRPSAD
jgi:hypothetical protein